MGWWVGAAGLVAMELSYLPQIVRLFRLRRADEVSVFFPALNVFGRLLALTYSYAKGEHVFTIGFLVGVVLRSTLLLQVVYYRWLSREARARRDESARSLDVLAANEVAT